MINMKPYEKFGFIAGQMMRMWRAEIDRRLAVHGLTESRWVTLFHLSRMGELASQKDLATAVGVKGPTMVKTLDWLESEGFIERRSLAADRRIKTIHLQDKASAKLKTINEVIAVLRDEIFTDIEESEIKTTLKVLTDISKKLTSIHRLE